MKKQLLFICAGISTFTLSAQIPSPDWNIQQYAPFPNNPTAATLQGVEFMDAVSPNILWVTGTDYNSTVNFNWWGRSLDGGNTFSTGVMFTLPSSTVSDVANRQLANFEAIDANTAWVSWFYTAGSNNPWQLNAQGNGGIHRTTNGGNTWVDMTATGMYTQTTSFCNIVTFLTPSLGITQGDPILLGGKNEFEIWRTTDGGLSWSAIPGSNIADPLPGEYAFVDSYAKLGTSYLWFGTNAGRIYYSTDAGINWSVSAVSPSGTGEIYDIAFSSPLDGVAILWNNSIPDVYNTNDGGVTWNPANPTGNWGQRDLRHIPGTNIIASFGSFGTIVQQYLAYTSDNGVTWTDWGSSGIDYYVGDFVNPSTGWTGSYAIPNSTITGNIWKYNGPALTTTTMPLSAFSMPLQICLGTSPATVTPVNSSSAAPSPSYTWAASGGATILNPNAAAPVISFATANSYTVTLTVSNGNATTSSQQVVDVISCVQPTVAFAANGSTLCNNKTFVLNNQSTGGSPAPSYSWSAPAGINFVPNAVVLSPSVTAPAGTYVFTLTAINAAGTVEVTKSIVVDDCSPTASFNIPDTLYRCPHTNTFIIINPVSTTSTTPAGINTLSWSILPSGTTPLTLVSLPSYSARATNTSVPAYTITLKATNASGTHTLSKVVRMNWNTTESFCDPASGIAENGNNLAIGIFPNPATTDINLKLADSRDVSVRLVNVLGSVVYDKTLETQSGSITLNLANLPRGVYFITVESNGKNATRKVILE